MKSIGNHTIAQEGMVSWITSLQPPATVCKLLQATPHLLFHKLLYPLHLLFTNCFICYILFCEKKIPTLYWSLILGNNGSILRPQPKVWLVVSFCLQSLFWVDDSQYSTWHHDDIMLTSQWCHVSWDAVPKKDTIHHPSHPLNGKWLAWGRIQWDARSSSAQRAMFR